MARRQFLSQKDLQRILDESSDDENGCGGGIVLNENTRVVYVPPAKVDNISDEECIDDDDLVTDCAPNLEIAGEIEVQYESVNDDFAAPPISTAETKLSPEENEYSSLKSFGEPKWKKTKRVDFKLDSPDEDGVRPLQTRIIEEMGKVIIQ